MTSSKPKPLAQGLLSKTPFAHLLIYVFNKKLTGSLEFEFENSPTIYFEKGMPCRIGSFTSITSLSSILKDHGALTAEQCQSLEGHTKAQPNAQFSLIKQQQLVSQSDLDEAVRIQMLNSILTLFPLTKEAYKFYASIDLTRGFSPLPLVLLDPYPTLMSGIRQYGNQLNLVAQLSKIVGKPLFLRNPAGLHRFHLSHDEMALCKTISEQNPTMDLLLSEDTFSNKLITAIIYVLLITKELQTGPLPTPAAVSSRPAPAISATPLIKTKSNTAKNKETAQQRTKTNSLPSPNSIKGEVSYDEKTKALRQRINDKAAQIAKQNYFELLNVPFDATSDDIKRAFFQQAKVFHPDKASKPELADLHDKLETIFAQLSEAQTALISDETRAEYLQSIKEGEARTSIMPKDENDEQGIMDTLNAETLYQKAVVLFRRNNRDNAKKFLDQAIALNPKQGEYTALWAHLQMLEENDPKKLGELVPIFRQSVEHNPKSEKIHHYFGKLLQKLNREAEAQVEYQKAVDANPNNIEAKRELRLMEMRKNKSKTEKKSSFLNRLLNK